MKKQTYFLFSTGVGIILVSFSLTAWFQIQAVRWGYKSQKIRYQIDELTKQEQVLDYNLHDTLSLERLDRLAKRRFSLRVPHPSQLVLLSDSG